MEDFITSYLEYTAETECPAFFHRWTAITSLAAFLGRRVFFTHGHFTVYPNLYTMLVGIPGTRKTSAIKIGAKVLKLAGYNTFAAKKTRQEKFLLDLAEQSEKKGGDNSILEDNLWGEEDTEAKYSSLPPAECFVAADEFNNFIGVSNLDFASILGELWDYEGVYDYRLKNSKSVFIPNPTITILGGNTPTGLTTAFPVEAIGQGFFSRLILVYSEPTGRKLTFPPGPEAGMQRKLLDMLEEVKLSARGEIIASSEAMELIDKIYMNEVPIDDLRFEHYMNRRLTHLLKLCIIMAVSRLSTTIEKEDVIRANTLLTVTERLMPKALGEFGKAKHSAVTHKIVTALDAANKPLKIQALWKLVHQDLDNRSQLIEIIGNLTLADKIQAIEGNAYLPKKEVLKTTATDSIDLSTLTREERGLI